jgi:two-component system chemotaxis response regulator CheB
MSSSQSKRIVVIGGSAGSLDPMLQLFSQLRSDLDASYFIVQHIGSNSPQYLPQLIARSGVIPAQAAQSEHPFTSARAYVAPPDYHLIIRDGSTVLSHGPRENRSRPAIDPLFRSAAVEYGTSVIGVLLSGMLDDGSAGLVAIKRCGGTTIVQDPQEASYPDMPNSALAALDVDHCVPVAEMAALIERLVREPVPEPIAIPEDLRLEVDILERLNGVPEKADVIGTRSSQACPDCGGPMWRVNDQHVERYRCTVGHSFTARSLLADQDDAIERALWAAARTLEERRRLLDHLGVEARGRGHETIAETYDRRRDETLAHIDQIKRLLLGRP